MIHPSGVDHFQKNDTLHLPKLFCLGELRFFRLIRLNSFLLEKMLQFFLIHLSALFSRGDFKLRDLVVECDCKPLNIPVVRMNLGRGKFVGRVLHILRDHIINRIAHALAVKNTASLAVDDLPLLVHYLIVLQKVFTNTEVIALYLLLGFLNGAGEHFVLDLLSVCDTQRVKHTHQALGTEQTHQVVFQRNIETGFSRVSLTSASSAELIVDTAGLVPLCADDLQAACLSRILIQLDIRTTASHVGSDRHRAVYTRVSDDLSLLLMVFGVQHIVLDAFFFKHFAEKFRHLYGDRTHQDRLSCGMGFFHRLHNSFVLFCFCLVYRVFQIFSLDWNIRRYLNHIHAVNIPELLLLCQSRTGHAALFVKFIKEVLECDRSKSLALPFYLYVLLRLNGLVQSVGVPAARHDTSGKFINDHDFSFRSHHIVLIFKHQIVGPKRKDNVVLYLKILRVGQVFNVEEFLHFLYAVLGQVDRLFFFVDNKVPGLLDRLAHDRIHLGKLSAGLAALQLTRENVTGLVQFGRLAALT